MTGILSTKEIEASDLQGDLDRGLPFLQGSPTLRHHLRWVCGEPNPPVTLQPKILGTLRGLGLVTQERTQESRFQWSPTVLGLIIYEEIR